MASRRDVIHCFKSLLRTSQRVFNEDNFALEKARLEIRKGFEQNRTQTDPAEIARLVKFGHDVRDELGAVARAEYNSTTGRYELRLEERHLTENAPWPPDPRTRGKHNQTPTGCCGGAAGDANAGKS